MTDPVTVCPGERLAALTDYIPGAGTYTQDNYILAALVGQRVVQQDANQQKPVVQVVRQTSQQTLLPEPGAVVTAKVTKINPRLASVDILCVGTRPLDDKFTGIIRLQDVRATEIDKVEIGNCFRPGDIVRAEVVSLGTSRDYYLSTAKNELGVVYAKSLAGVPMIPISWQEMQCPQTKSIEKRKVARVSS
jgi:exosome complex component CSL4